MRKIKLIFLCMAFYITALHAEEIQYINDGVVQYYCNDKNSNFYFSAEPHAQYLRGIKKYNINVDSLLISKEGSEGNMIRLGSKKEIRQYGVIKLIFESGYYNANVHGLLGLLDYPIISISINGKSIIDKKPLNLCASGGTRAVCPTDFSIQAIGITKKSNDLYQLILTKALPVDEGDSFKLKSETLKLKVK